MNKHLQIIAQRLADSRSKKVMFVSHCVLNENTRYLGGAFSPAVVPHLLEEIVAAGCGIVQLPCPEQRAWGGILKPLLWQGVGIQGRFFYSLRNVLFRIFIWHSRRVLRKMAREVVRQVKDYARAGYEVLGLLGIGGSPTCGVFHTLDLTKFETLANFKIETLNKEEFNKIIYEQFYCPGQGLFIQELEQILKQHQINLLFFEHDLKEEMAGHQHGIWQSSNQGG